MAGDTLTRTIDSINSHSANGSGPSNNTRKPSASSPRSSLSNNRNRTGQHPRMKIDVPPPGDHDRPSSFTDSPNARSKSITVAQGSETYGVLNRHPQPSSSSPPPAFHIGVHDDRGQRRTMEDAYSFVVDFAGVKGQGYFAVFDGHAGKYAAEWCGAHFHEQLLHNLSAYSDLRIPDILNHTFNDVDRSLSQLADKDDKMHSGCTAVTAFLRVEDEHGGQSFLSGVSFARGEDGEDEGENEAEGEEGSEAEKDKEGGGKKRRSGRLLNAFKHRSNSNSNSNTNLAALSPPAVSGGAASPSSALHSPNITPSPTLPPAYLPPASLNLRRVLYTANAGDARAVLCRAGKAVRLTYDHKGIDRQEAKRIVDAGGFVMGGRVNGVLAVTRSLGDSSMKEFVVGSPYTTETELGEGDEFLIVACDGLWDIATDQEAVDLVRDIPDAQAASKFLVDHALKDSTDNITVLVVRFLWGEGGMGAKE